MNEMVKAGVDGAALARARLSSGWRDRGMALRGHVPGGRGLHAPGLAGAHDAVAISDPWITDQSRRITLLQLAGGPRALRITGERFRGDPPVTAIIGLEGQPFSELGLDREGRYTWDVVLPAVAADQIRWLELQNVPTPLATPRKIWKVQSIEVLG